jgi:hypothetical protein
MSKLCPPPPHNIILRIFLGNSNSNTFENDPFHFLISHQNDVYELFSNLSVLTGSNFTVNIGVLVGSEVITAVTMKSTIIWVVTPRAYRTTLRYNKENGTLHLNIWSYQWVVFIDGLDDDFRTNCIEQNPSWEANTHLRVVISLLLGNSKLHCPIHKKPPLLPSLNKINQFSSLLPSETKQK